MALTSAQLIMLDTLIYANNKDTGEGYVSENAKVSDILTAIENDMYNVDGCMMTPLEWKELVDKIWQEQELLEYRVTNYYPPEDEGEDEYIDTGMRAACFVNDIENPTDVNVVFRGTNTEYEWHDNGQGAYLPETEEQKRAAKYVQELPAAYGNSMTVTGHSKGGNKAQYVTIATDRISKCISVDGQGFSEEFLHEYKDEIASKAENIVSISASEDYVNCLLYPIAGTQIYIQTEDQKNDLHNHKPNILLDENGELSAQTEQANIPKLIHEYSTYMISNMEEPQRSATIDGLINVVIAALDSDSTKLREAVLENWESEVATISYLDNFGFDFIGEKYGLPAEMLATYTASLINPVLFMDDLLNCGKETLSQVVAKMEDFSRSIEAKIQAYEEKKTVLEKKFVASAEGRPINAEDYRGRNATFGNYIAGSENLIIVDTAKMRVYADRLKKVNSRLNKLETKAENLYQKIGLRDLYQIVQADWITESCGRISNNVKYLDETANDFDMTEKNVANLF